MVYVHLGRDLQVKGWQATFLPTFNCGWRINFDAPVVRFNASPAD